MEFPALLRVFLTRAIRFALLLVLGHPIQHLIAIVTHAVAEGSGVAEAFLGVTLMGAKLSVLPFLDCLDFLGYLGEDSLLGDPPPSWDFGSLVFWNSLVNFKEGISLVICVFLCFFQGFSGYGRG